MTKSETLKQLAAASNEARLDKLNQQIERLREAKLTSAEELATLLEPLAQAMAALTDETRASLEQVQEYNKEQSKQFLKQLENVTTAWYSGRCSTAGGRTAGGSRAENGTQSLPAGRSDRNDDGASRERILALAGTGADIPERAGRESGSGITQTRDLSAEAAQRQMTAMGVNRFVVMLRMVSHDVVYEDFAGIGV
jgi:predicted membrane metal-binding protein